jgi:hypothetical protein
MTRRSSRAVLALSILLAVPATLLATMITAAPAAAQTADALGRPLPSPDLPVGTVTVRVVAGSGASPVTGTDVTLLVNDTPRIARTDSAGRASFAGLPPGATVLAKVVDADKAEHASEPFKVPGEGGTRLMISTKPWKAPEGGGGGDGAGGPFAGGGAGMPNPRQMSGEPRVQAGDPPGTITVRVTYDDFQDTPEGMPVVLVGYAADATTTYQVVKTDRAGRAVFSDLDRSGGTSYFAMADLPRNGGIDRLRTTFMVLDAQSGVRVMLSAEKRASKAPAIDDLHKMDPQTGTPAGKVRVVLAGAGQIVKEISLVDVATRKVLAKAAPVAGSPDPSRLQGGADFEPDPKLPAGTLDVVATGGPGAANEPLPGVEIRVIAASSDDATGGLGSVTGADGTVRMALQVREPQKALFTINGRPLVSNPFDLAASGGKLRIRANWEDVGQSEALFDVTPAPGQVVYAEGTFRDQFFRSLPVLLSEGHGTKVTVYVAPRVRLGFVLRAGVEDELLAVQGRFTLTNESWVPYRAGPDGLVVPAPHGFKGGVVFGADQNEVAVDAEKGFRIMRPLPPLGRQFHGGYSLPVVDGVVEWALDLPLGATSSEFAIREVPGMVVRTPPKAEGKSHEVEQGKFFVIGPIDILPNQSMSMTIEGLPTRPAWRIWLPGILGVLAVLVMVGGVYFALFRKPVQSAAATAAAANLTRRQRLLDELVELERSGGNPRRREQVLAELEDLWG